MNLFWLSLNFAQCAYWHCDQHISKIPTEAVQLLYSAWCVLGGPATDAPWRATAPFNKSRTLRGYRATHLKHPLARWVRRSSENYRLCLRYAKALCHEFTLRFHKQHAAQQHLAWLEANLPPALPDRPRTPLPLCTQASKGRKSKTLEEAISVYRKCYQTEKHEFVRYRYTTPPPWMPAADYLRLSKK